MNSSAITRARVARREKRLDDSANSALELAARRRREALEAANKACAKIDAIKAQSTEEIVSEVFGVPPEAITYGPQRPATLPPVPVVNDDMDARVIAVSRLISVVMGGLTLFIAGVAVGRLL